MYYLSFFIDYDPFFKKKINSWISNKKKYKCYLLNDFENYNSISISNFLNFSQSDSFYCNEPWSSRYDNLWYISGLKNKHFTPEASDILIKKSKISVTLDEIDLLLSWFADNYQWSIIPWNNMIRIPGFVFISEKAEVAKKFIQCSSNTCKAYSDSIKESNLLINSYEVFSKFSEVTKAIVFEENVNTVGEIWDACHCDHSNPQLLTNINLDQNYLPNFGNSRLNSSLTKNPATRKQHRNWHSYIVHNKTAFELISRELILKSNISAGSAFWTSNNTDIDQLQRLLIKAESHAVRYSDLSYLQDFLDICEWLYGFGRDITAPDNHNCSLFISQSSNIIQEINMFRQENNILCPRFNYYYDLLSCC